MKAAQCATNQPTNQPTHRRSTRVCDLAILDSHSLDRIVVRGYLAPPSSAVFTCVLACPPSSSIHLGDCSNSLAPTAYKPPLTLSLLLASLPCGSPELAARRYRCLLVLHVSFTSLDLSSTRSFSYILRRQITERACSIASLLACHHLVF